MSATVVGRFLEGLDARQHRVAIRWRDAEGNWHGRTYGQFADQVARVAAGLRHHGVRRGQRVLLMMRNIAEFHVADLAVLFAGAVPVSIYNSSSSEQIAYLAAHSDAALAIVEDESFLARFDVVRDRLPKLVTFVSVHGAPGRDDVVEWDSLQGFGALDLAAEAEAVSADDTATVIYTSGTTGAPKGVVITHANVCAQLEAQAELFEDPEAMRVVSFLPMAHIAERAISHYGLIINGLQVSCCPDFADLGSYLVDVRPQLLFGVPRVWEKIRAKVLASLIADGEKATRFDAAIEAAKPISIARSWGAASDEQNALWDRLQDGGLRAVREATGLDQVEIAITGAAPIPAEVIEWYNALGVPLSEVYGLSENTGGMTWTKRRIKPGTVGTPFPNADVRIGDDGEVLLRGPLVFAGCLNAPDQTREAIDSDGWLHTGDIGALDDDGYLKIVDRKKELIITSGGKNISPANLEAALKSIPLVGQAFVVGDRKPYTAALVLLDPEIAPRWAAIAGVEFDSLADLADSPQVAAEINQCLDRAMEPFNHAEKVKKVRVLGAEWLPDSDELTPTSKLKRRVIAAKYAQEIEALY